MQVFLVVVDIIHISALSVRDLDHVFYSLFEMAEVKAVSGFPLFHIHLDIAFLGIPGSLVYIVCHVRYGSIVGCRGDFCGLQFSRRFRTGAHSQRQNQNAYCDQAEPFAIPYHHARFLSAPRLILK